MADSNSQPPLCPCGFFGSPQTQGLCSKCYKEHLQKVGQAGAGSTPASSTLTASAISKAFDEVKALSTEEAAAAPASADPADLVLPSTSNGSGSHETTEEKTDCTESNKGDVDDDKLSDTPPPTKEPSPGNKRELEEALDPDRPVQKNKKRCFKCNCKLELALREIGRCRCDYIFCPLHRLPEQHDCMYDHKEKGRQEAREKMVSPKKHMGTSLKRIDSDS